VALTVRSPHARRFFFLPIVIISIYLLSSPIKTGLPFIADYLFTCGQLSNVIIASDYLILTDVQATFRLKGQTVPISTLPFYSRLNWATELVGSPRGIGWTHEPSKVLPKPRRAYERNDNLTKFTIDQVTRLSFYIFLFLLVGTYDKWDTPKRLHPLLLRPVNALVWAIPIIIFLDGIHRLLGLILVHARRLKPGDWIPLFGSLSEAYTIRRFWGRVWHQMLRRFTASHSTFLSQHVLRLEKGTRAFFYVQILTAFLASTLIHAIADWIFIGDWHGAFYFFLSQATAIFIEDTFTCIFGDSMCVRKAGPTIRRLLGYLWVIGWFTFSTPLWHISFVDK